MNSNEKLLEAELTTIAGVECPEYMLTQLVTASTREESVEKMSKLLNIQSSS